MAFPSPPPNSEAVSGKLEGNSARWTDWFRQVWNAFNLGRFLNRFATADLPPQANEADVAYATDGQKAGEAFPGTGVPMYYSDGAWRNFTGSTGSPTARSVIAVAVNTVAPAGNNIYECSAAAGNVTLTIPAPATMAGEQIDVNKTDATANTVTIVPAVGTINGAANLVIAFQYTNAQMYSNGSQWRVM